MSEEERKKQVPTEQGAQGGARTQAPGIMTWAESSQLTDWATQASQLNSLSCGSPTSK